MPRAKEPHADDLRPNWREFLKTVIVPACGMDWDGFLAAAPTEPASFARRLNGRRGSPYPTIKTLSAVARILKIHYLELRRSLLPSSNIRLNESPEELARGAEKGSQIYLKRLTTLANSGNSDAPSCSFRPWSVNPLNVAIETCTHARAVIKQRFDAQASAENEAVPIFVPTLTVEALLMVARRRNPSLWKCLKTSLLSQKNVT